MEKLASQTLGSMAWDGRTIYLPHTSPQLAVVRTLSCSLPRCQPVDSHCPQSLPPWSKFLSGCLGDGTGPGSAQDWAACEVPGFPLPLLACVPPGSLFHVDLWLCNEGCGAEIQLETMTLAFHLGWKEGEKRQWYKGHLKFRFQKGTERTLFCNKSWIAKKTTAQLCRWLIQYINYH